MLAPLAKKLKQREPTPCLKSSETTCLCAALIYQPKSINPSKQYTSVTSCDFSQLSWNHLRDCFKPCETLKIIEKKTVCVLFTFQEGLEPVLNTHQAIFTPFFP